MTFSSPLAGPRGDITLRGFVGGLVIMVGAWPQVRRRR